MYPSVLKKPSRMETPLRAARLYGIDAGQAGRETVVICERLGIARKRLGRPTEQMSRGMQQKVAIARALLTSPALLLLDEPTTGLDPRSKLEVQDFIEDVRTNHDASIVLTTHDLDEAERLSDRIAVLNDGRVVAEDSPNGLKRLVAERHGQRTRAERRIQHTGTRRQTQPRHAPPHRFLNHGELRWRIHGGKRRASGSQGQASAACAALGDGRAVQACRTVRGAATDFKCRSRCGNGIWMFCSRKARKISK